MGQWVEKAIKDRLPQLETFVTSPSFMSQYFLRQYLLHLFLRSGSVETSITNIGRSSKQRGKESDGWDKSLENAIKVPTLSTRYLSYSHHSSQGQGSLNLSLHIPRAPKTLPRPPIQTIGRRRNTVVAELGGEVNNHCLRIKARLCHPKYQ